MSRQDGTTLAEQLGIDPVWLRARYREERDKRLRADGIKQYVSLKDGFDDFGRDPYIAELEARAPLEDEVDVAVIGCGFGGLLLGAHLRRAGIENIRFIDRAADFGGVWYWNRYPGAACDTESYIYLPLLEELGYMPERKYARAPEIRTHCRRIAQHFDLYRDTCFSTTVTGLSWDDGSNRWIVSTDRGDAMRAKFVALSSGPLDRPKLPGIAGLDTFTGHAFHTSRWDYAYTDGDSEGGLSGLADKAVGIIGTGATAVQCIPYLARDARHLFVFQRTPSSIDVRDDRPTDPSWAAGLAPGWQRRRIENFTTLVSGGDADENLIDDGWTSLHKKAQHLRERLSGSEDGHVDGAEVAVLANFVKMEELRARVDSTVADPATAEALKPWYDYFCKRPCFHDDYLQVFNRNNVTLVDTGGKGVERIEGSGVFVGDRRYDIDCLIYSTGFEVGELLSKRIGIDIRGRTGASLIDHWVAGPSTLHGFMTRGFPNLLFLSHVQSGLSLNFPHMIAEQAEHAAYIVSNALNANAKTIEPSAEAERAWVAEVERTAPFNEEFNKECTPSYFNFEGEQKRANVRNSAYGGGPMAFYRILAEWREKGSMPGLELTL